MNKITLRTIQGAVFAMGAPLGWLLIQYIAGVDIELELTTNWGLYAYMLFGSLAAFILFGGHVGRQEQKITEIASCDALTGIYNLRFFNEQVKQEISRAKRDSLPLSIICFDLDYFKKINDQYGHPAGDIVLRKISGRVKQITRGNDIFARVGGEEFCILLPNCGLDNAKTNAERIRFGIESLKINITDVGTLKTTVSIGVASWKSGETFSHFYKRVDEKLYLAKQNGRNRVESE